MEKNQIQVFEKIKSQKIKRKKKERGTPQKTPKKEKKRKNQDTEVDRKVEKDRIATQGDDLKVGPGRRVEKKDPRVEQEGKADRGVDLNGGVHLEIKTKEIDHPREVIDERVGQGVILDLNAKPQKGKEGNLLSFFRYVSLLFLM